jgi:predicted amidohydrolase YtcJ
LPDNPVTVGPMTIRDIEVLETINEGQAVYRAR